MLRGFSDGKVGDERGVIGGGESGGVQNDGKPKRRDIGGVENVVVCLLDVGFRLGTDRMNGAADGSLFFCIGGSVRKAGIIREGGILFIAVQRIEVTRAENGNAVRIAKAPDLLRHFRGVNRAPLAVLRQIVS